MMEFLKWEYYAQYAQYMEKNWKVVKAMFQTNQPDIHYTVLLFKRKPGGMSWILGFLLRVILPVFFATFHGEIPQVPDGSSKKLLALKENHL